MSEITSPAAPAAPAPGAQGAPQTAPTSAPAASDEDALEAEYQAAMAKARGEGKKKKPDPRQPEAADDGDEQETDEKTAPDESEAEEEDHAADDDNKTWKLNVNGKEKELNEQQMIKAAQIGVAANEKFEAAKRIEQRSQQFINLLQTNPGAILTHPKSGIDPATLKEFCENYLYKGIEEARMTPEERAAREEKQELEKFREREARAKEQRETKRREQAKEQLRQQWTEKMVAAIEQSDLPRTDWAVQRMAHYMRVANQRGMKHIQPADVVPYVKQDFLNHQRQFFKNTPDDKLIETLGEEQAARVRKANLKAKGVQTGQAKPAGGGAAPAPRAGQTYASAEEMRDAAIARAKRGR